MFQLTTRQRRIMAGSRNLPGVSQAISSGMATFTISSSRGTARSCFIQGFSSVRPRDTARKVKARSNWFRSTKEAFSVVHCLNVPADCQRFIVISIVNSPAKLAPLGVHL